MVDFEKTKFAVLVYIIHNIKFSHSFIITIYFTINRLLLLSFLSSNCLNQKDNKMHTSLEKDESLDFNRINHVCKDIYEHK